MTNTRLSVVLQRGAAALWSSHAKPKKKNCNHQQQQPQQKKKKRLLFPVYLDERETEVLTAGDGQTETGRKNVNSRSHSLVHKDMDEFRSVDKFLDFLITVYETFASRDNGIWSLLPCYNYKSQLCASQQLTWINCEKICPRHSLCF